MTGAWILLMTLPLVQAQALNVNVPVLKAFRSAEACLKEAARWKANGYPGYGCVYFEFADGGTP